MRPMAAKEGSAPAREFRLDEAVAVIHGEKTDWIPRARIILDHGDSRPFVPFDRFAQLQTHAKTPMSEMLDEFAQRRARNLAELAEMKLGPSELESRGRHPELGTVTLAELLATWVAHD